MGYFSRLSLDSRDECEFEEDRSYPSRAFLLQWRLDELLDRRQELMSMDTPPSGGFRLLENEIDRILPRDLFCLRDVEKAIAMTKAEIVRLPPVKLAASAREASPAEELALTLLEFLLPAA